MQDLARYAFVNAQIRAKKGSLLHPNEIDKLINTNDFEESLSLLRTSPYGVCLKDSGDTINDLQHLEKKFTEFDIAIYRSIIANLSDETKRLLSLLLQRYELEEVKVLLRAWRRHIDSQIDQLIIAKAFIHPINYEKILHARGIEELLDAFDGTPYKLPIQDSWGMYQKTEVFFYVEAALDNDYFDRVWKQIDRLTSKDRQIARRLFGIEVDIENINRLLRLTYYFGMSPSEALKFVLPRGFKIKEDLLRALATDGIDNVIQKVAHGPFLELAVVFRQETEGTKLHLIEAVLAQTLYDETQRIMMGFPFTIGAALAYFIQKRFETRRIISILYAKKYGHKPDKIREQFAC